MISAVADICHYEIFRGIYTATNIKRSICASQQATNNKNLDIYWLNDLRAMKEKIERPLKK